VRRCCEISPWHPFHDSKIVVLEGGSRSRTFVWVLRACVCTPRKLIVWVIKVQKIQHVCKTQFIGQSLRCCEALVCVALVIN
jgi:hypothetical protein